MRETASWIFVPVLFNSNCPKKECSGAGHPAAPDCAAAHLLPIVTKGGLPWLTSHVRDSGKNVYLNHSPLDGVPSGRGPYASQGDQSTTHSTARAILAWPGPYPQDKRQAHHQVQLQAVPLMFRPEMVGFTSQSYFSIFVSFQITDVAGLKHQYQETSHQGGQALGNSTVLRACLGASGLVRIPPTRAGQTVTLDGY